MPAGYRSPPPPGSNNCVYALYITVVTAGPRDFLARLQKMRQNDTTDAKTEWSGQLKASSHYPALAYC